MSQCNYIHVYAEGSPPVWNSTFPPRKVCIGLVSLILPNPSVSLLGLFVEAIFLIKRGKGPTISPIYHFVHYSVSSLHKGEPHTLVPCSKHGKNENQLYRGQSLIRRSFYKEKNI